MLPSPYNYSSIGTHRGASLCTMELLKTITLSFDKTKVTDWVSAASAGISLSSAPELRNEHGLLWLNLASFHNKDLKLALKEWKRHYPNETFDQALEFIKRSTPLRMESSQQLC